MPNSLQPTLTKTVSMHAMFTQEKLELLSQVNLETHVSFHLVMTRLKAWLIAPKSLSSLVSLV